MTEDRPYRRAMTQDEAIAQLHQGSGSQFDPQVVDAFVRILNGDSEKTSVPVATPRLAEG
jgi:HD-GYP domain-containing protein (c-di-GMP phosphodiesterase class II)